MTTRQVGDVTITRIEEWLGPGFAPTEFFADFDPAVLERHKDWLAPNFIDPATGMLIVSVHSWLVKTPRHTILVDTCGGNDKNRPAFPGHHQQQGPWLQRLEAAGARPEDIDFVMCTHLHVDHVGWNTRLIDGRWVPTFPNAKYIFSKEEREFWDPTRGLGDGVGGPATMDGPFAGVFDDSVLPVIEAGQAVMVDGDHQIDDGMFVVPAPGHTHGHLSVQLRSQDREALFSGDSMHHPLQIYNPDWNSCFCAIPDLARRTRRGLLEHCVEHDALILPAHFGAPHAGRIRARGDSFAFLPEA